MKHIFIIVISILFSVGCLHNTANQRNNPDAAIDEVDGQCFKYELPDLDTVVDDEIEKRFSLNEELQIPSEKFERACCIETVSGDEKKQTIVTFDKNGRIEKRVTFNQVTGEIDYKIEFTNIYDENNRIISHGVIRSVGPYELLLYKYDEKGNLFQMYETQYYKSRTNIIYLNKAPLHTMKLYDVQNGISFIKYADLDMKKRKYYISEVDKDGCIFEQIEKTYDENWLVTSEKRFNVDVHGNKKIWSDVAFKHKSVNGNITEVKRYRDGELIEETKADFDSEGRITRISILDMKDKTEEVSNYFYDCTSDRVAEQTLPGDN